MTISHDLLLAILSMDAYNRGYRAGIADDGVGDSDGLGGIGSAIGTATVVMESDVEPESPGVENGFYALSYSWNGQTIISYRGTDFEDDMPSVLDVANGWAVGGGDFRAEQVELATQFLAQVEAATTTGFVLTGHSLGGGLAHYASGNTNPGLPQAGSCCHLI